MGPSTSQTTLFSGPLHSSQSFCNLKQVRLRRPPPAQYIVLHPILFKDDSSSQSFCNSKQVRLPRPPPAQSIPSSLLYDQESHPYKVFLDLPRDSLWSKYSLQTKFSSHILLLRGPMRLSATWSSPSLLHEFHLAIHYLIFTIFYCENS